MRLPRVGALYVETLADRPTSGVNPRTYIQTTVQLETTTLNLALCVEHYHSENLYEYKS